MGHPPQTISIRTIKRKQRGPEYLGDCYHPYNKFTEWCRTQRIIKMLYVSRKPQTCRLLLCWWLNHPTSIPISHHHHGRPNQISTVRNGYIHQISPIHWRANKSGQNKVVSTGVYLGLCRKMAPSWQWCPYITNNSIQNTGHRTPSPLTTRTA